MLNRLKEYYEEHTLKVDLSFFLGGFIFDIFTLADVNDSFSILQQILYLSFTALIIYGEFSPKLQQMLERSWIKGLWSYRQLLSHFMLGSLLSIYSIYFVYFI